MTHSTVTPRAIVKREDVTPQSLRTAQSYVDSRGPGESLTEAIQAMIGLLVAGKDVTVSYDTACRARTCVELGGVCQTAHNY